MVRGARRPNGDNGRMRYRIEQYREALDMSAAKLAELVGISRQQMRRLEKGERRVTNETLLALAEALGRDPVDLLDFDSVDDLDRFELNQYLTALMNRLDPNRLKSVVNSVEMMVGVDRSAASEARAETAEPEPGDTASAAPPKSARAGKPNQAF